MNAFTYSIHPLAAKEYYDAAEWYNEQQPGLGELFLQAVRSKIELILDNPNIYSSKYRKNYREASLDNFPFVIVYRVNTKAAMIFVTSIHHMKKSPQRKYRK